MHGQAYRVQVYEPVTSTRIADIRLPKTATMVFTVKPASDGTWICGALKDGRSATWFAPMSDSGKARAIVGTRADQEDGACRTGLIGVTPEGGWLASWSGDFDWADTTISRVDGATGKVELMVDGTTIFEPTGE